jgi:hypothetical protein
MAVERDGRKVPMYFDAVAHAIPGDLNSKLEGRGRFNVETYLLGRAGVDVARFGANGRLAAQYLWDVFFPFAVLFMVSLLTRDRQASQGVQFFGKMKTPVGSTPEIDRMAVEATRSAPERFDHLKLLGPGSSWELTRWDRVDVMGFAICCALSAGLIGVFYLLLRWAAG